MTSKPSRLRLFMQLCCVFLLLFAQHAALAHAVWHAHQQLPAQDSAHVNAGAVHDAPAASAACAMDVAFSEVLGAAACHSAPAVVASDAREGVLARRLASVTAEFLAPLSRGPPALPMT